MNQQLLKMHGITPVEIDEAVLKAVNQITQKELTHLYDQGIKDFKTSTIIKGKIVYITDKECIVDVGYKSEGIIPRTEFADPDQLHVGDEIEVFLDGFDDETGFVLISKSKADQMKGWETILNSYKIGDVIKGRITRVIKGGVLVDIGAIAFLPSSQIDIKRVEDMFSLIGKQIDCKIIKIDTDKKNIIVSRRQYLEEQKEINKQRLMSELTAGETREGVVKNITDFGAFVDLGGVDGLLHIGDMSWVRLSHPSELVALDQRIKVKILKIEAERGHIVLGLKQLTKSPWEDIEQKYPMGSKAKAKVVNIVPYGAFVQLEPGIEGLVHISEMSWTKRLKHPSELVVIGDVVEVVILKIDRDKQELALGIKQAETNPWLQIKEKYSPGTKIQGRVKNLTSYGAFIEIAEGIDGLLHISDFSWINTGRRPAELIKKGDKLEAVVLNVDSDEKRISLGLKQLAPNPWDVIIPQKYQIGAVAQGKVTKLTPSGGLLELESGIEGWLSLLASSPVPVSPSPEAHEKTPVPNDNDPQPVAQELTVKTDQTENKEFLLKIGETVPVEIIKLDPAEGKIYLQLVKT